MLWKGGARVLNSEQRKWADGLKQGVIGFIDSLADPNQPGGFKPCRRGATADGRKLSLGFSCLALKVYYTLGAWEQASASKRAAWLEFINSFQSPSDSVGSEFPSGSFLDPALITALKRGPRGWGLVRRLLGRTAPPAPLSATIYAETKQALATLAEVDARPRHPYTGFPQTRDELKAWLQAQPWETPWAAGGRSAAITVFTVTQAPKLLGREKASDLVQELRGFFGELADPASGAYFRGPTPPRGQIINGAMKVLTALDWLGEPVHHPERLIDTCLQELPSSEGCHLVDWIYVLYRSLKYTDHRRGQAAGECLRALEMIREHHLPDGGFSYYLGRSQTNYYGVEIAKGSNESDIHGTCLLVWALAMLLQLVGHDAGWRVIKP